jgi:hypothetical protein
MMHKTRSVFDRYNILNESDIEEAALKIEDGWEKASTRLNCLHNCHMCREQFSARLDRSK